MFYCRSHWHCFRVRNDWLSARETEEAPAEPACCEGAGAGGRAGRGAGLGDPAGAPAALHLQTVQTFSPGRLAAVQLGPECGGQVVSAGEAVYGAGRLLVRTGDRTMACYRVVGAPSGRSQLLWTGRPSTVPTLL